MAPCRVPGKWWVRGRYVPPISPSPLDVLVGKSGIKVWMVIQWLKLSDDSRDVLLRRYGNVLTKEDVESAVWFYDRYRESGHDVLFAGDVGRKGRADAWNFRQALEEQRILITFNRRDFEYLHKLWTTLVILGTARVHHSGIITSAPTKTFTPTEWLPAVLDILAPPTSTLAICCDGSRHQPNGARTTRVPRTTDLTGRR